MSNGKTFTLSIRPDDRITVAPHVDGGVSISVNDALRVALAHLTADEAHDVIAELALHVGDETPEADAKVASLRQRAIDLKAELEQTKEVHAKALDALRAHHLQEIDALTAPATASKDVVPDAKLEAPPPAEPAALPPKGA